MTAIGGCGWDLMRLGPIPDAYIRMCVRGVSNGPSRHTGIHEPAGNHPLYTPARALSGNGRGSPSLWPISGCRLLWSLYTRLHAPA